MSSDAGAGDRDDPDGATQIILRAAEAFDGRDHVMSVAACKLHIWGTCDSAARNQPGFVPDEYVGSLTGEHMGSSGAEPAILAAELCTAGMWERVDGGYRVLDWREIQTCVDYVRELRDKDKRAPAGEGHDRVNKASQGLPGRKADQAQPTGATRLGQRIGQEAPQQASGAPPAARWLAS